MATAEEPWFNATAFELLRVQARDKLDGRCVEALIAHETEIVGIRAAFPDGDLS